MKCTGHSAFRTMRPYVEVADKTTACELPKWNIQAKKIEIGIFHEKASEDKLEQSAKIVESLKKHTR